MYCKKLEDMSKGWFVGNFEPTLYQTNEVEVAVKHYKAGDKDVAHYHKIATEITVIVSGTVSINGKEYSAGDMIVMEPGDVSDFMALTDAINTVVKLPGANDDKYLVEEKRC